MKDEINRYFALMEERPEAFRASDVISIVTDRETIEAYCRENKVRLGVVYESKYHLMVVDLVKNAQGKLFPYERILNTVPGGSVMLTLHNGKLVLLEQFRHALREKQYAFPRGFRELGFSGLENARKEMQEELDLPRQRAVSYAFLGTVVADSGLSGNAAEVFLVTVTDGEALGGRATEGILGTAEVSERAFLAMIKEGKITDGFTLSAYSLWKAAREDPGVC